METKTRNMELYCSVCKEKITGEYMQANIDTDLKSTNDGVVVCSETCAREYEQKLPHQGQPIQQFSRITGYYQNITGWNAGKRQELKDRKRYGISVNDEKRDSDEK